MFLIPCLLVSWIDWAIHCWYVRICETDTTVFSPSFSACIMATSFTSNRSIALPARGSKVRERAPQIWCGNIRWVAGFSRRIDALHRLEKPVPLCFRKNSPKTHAKGIIDHLWTMLKLRQPRSPNQVESSFKHDDTITKPPFSVLWQIDVFGMIALSSDSSVEPSKVHILIIILNSLPPIPWLFSMRGSSAKNFATLVPISSNSHFSLHCTDCSTTQRYWLTATRLYCIDPPPFRPLEHGRSKSGQWYIRKYFPMGYHSGRFLAIAINITKIQSELVLTHFGSHCDLALVSGGEWRHTL